MEISVQTVVKYYNDFNQLFFNGELPGTVYLGVHDSFKVPGRYDYYVNDYGEITRQSISISRSFDYEPKQFRNILIHEMIHLYLIYFGIDNGKQEHGPKFMEMMNMMNSIHQLGITVNQDLTQFKPAKGTSKMKWFFTKNF